MTTENCLAPAIRAYEKILSQIQKSKEKIDAIILLLQNRNDQSNEKTAQRSRHEEFAECQRNLDNLSQYFEEVAEFCCSAAQTLSQSMLLVATYHSEEISIQQNSTEMEQIYMDIRSTHVKNHMLGYGFAFEIESTVNNMLNLPSGSSSNKKTTALRRYQEFLRVVKSVTNSVPKSHIESAGSTFLRIFQGLLRRPNDTQQHIYHRTWVQSKHSSCHRTNS